MTRDQRVRYEMFVRVRGFGERHAVEFPPSSSGGKAFARLTTVVSDIEGHLMQRDLGRAGAQRVNASARGKLREYMKAMARTARRIDTIEPGRNPFTMPKKDAFSAVIAQAHVFLVEATARQDAFVGLGMRPDFINDFRSVLEEFEGAVTVQRDSLSLRRSSQAGLEAAMDQAFEIVSTLDVIVKNVLPDSPILGGWDVARRLPSRRAAAKRKAAKLARRSRVAQSVAAPVAPASSPASVAKPLRRRRRRRR